MVLAGSLLDAGWVGALLSEPLVFPRSVPVVSFDAMVKEGALSWINSAGKTCERIVGVNHGDSEEILGFWE